MVWTTGRIITLVIFGLISIGLIFFLGKKFMRRVISAKPSS
jgi:hypothetical protein